MSSLTLWKALCATAILALWSAVILILLLSYMAEDKSSLVSNYKQLEYAGDRGK